MIMPRYTIDLDENFDRVLNELVSTTGASTKADVIRRAVASYKFLKSQAPEDGNNVSITTKDGKILKDVVLP
jgi:hypothetical protein